MFFKVRSFFKRHSQWAFAILVLIFAVPLVTLFTTTDFTTGGGEAELKVRIRGEKISPAQLESAIKTARVKIFMDYYGQRQAPIDEESLAIDRLALLAEADRLQIRVTHEQIEGFYTNYIPYQLVKTLLYREIKKANPLLSEEEVNRRLQTEFEGQLNGRRLKLEDVDRFAAEEVRLRELQRAVGACAKLTPLEVQQLYALYHEKTAVDIMEVASSAFTNSVTVTEDDLKKYHSTHPQELTIPERVKVLFVRFSPDEFKAEVKITEADITRYYNQNPEQFRNDKGEPEPLSAHQEKIRNKLVMEAAKNLAIDKASELVEKLYNNPKSVKTDEDDIRAFYSEHAAGLVDPEGQSISLERLKTDPAMATLYMGLQRRAFGVKAMKVYGADLNRKLESTGFFSELDTLPELKVGPDFLRKAFSVNESRLFIDAHDGSASYVLALLDFKGPEVPPLELVRDKVRQLVVTEKSFEAALAEAENRIRAIREKLAQGQSFQQALESLQFKAVSPAPFSLWSIEAGTVGDIPQLRTILPALFEMNDGNLSRALRTPAGAVFVHLRERLPVDPQAFEKEKTAFESALWRKEWQTVYTAWFTNKVAPEIQVTGPGLDR